MGTDSLGADNPIYHLSHAVVLIALVRHLGMVRKGNTVAEHVSGMVHAPVPGTSRLLAPPQREIWRHDGLLSSIGYASPIPMCTRYDGMTIPGGSLSRSCTLECLYPGLRTCPVQCRRPTQHDMNGRWTICITNTRYNRPELFGGTR